MSPQAASSEKVHYELRPLKQVERRMLIHALQGLMNAGFPIQNYQYTGMGSIYFVDFVLFHRYLGIAKFLSVEQNTEIENRVRFNKPYACIDLEMGDIASYIPTLDQSEKHFLWLDFDWIISKGILETISLAASQLSEGSILMITVDAEPPGRKEDKGYGPRSWKRYFLQEVGEYIWSKPKLKDFALDKLSESIIRLISSALKKGFSGRGGIELIPLFNFVYADGHKMISLGGMVGADAQRENLKKLNRKDLFFLRDSFGADACEIKIPKVTRKERLHLDSKMPCVDGWVPDEFEFSKENVKAYKDIYRYYPSFTEMLL